MLELYHNKMSVCAQKVRLALEELELQWNSHHLNLRGDEQLCGDYLRINPKGQVPSLVDGDTIVIESTVINEYLADAYGGDWLLPNTPAGRARMRWWTRQLDDDVHYSTGVMSVSIAFLHQYLANSPEMLAHILRAIPDEGRRNLKERAFGTGLDNPDLPISVRRMDKLMQNMNNVLAVDEWLAGDSYSLADLAYTSYMLRMEHLNMTILFDDRPHLRSWMTRVRSRPSFGRAIEKWLDPDYVALAEKTGLAAKERIASMRAE